MFGDVHPLETVSSLTHTIFFDRYCLCMLSNLTLHQMADALYDGNSPIQPHFLPILDPSLPLCHRQYAHFILEGVLLCRLAGRSNFPFASPTEIEMCLSAARPLGLWLASNIMR